MIQNGMLASAAAEAEALAAQIAQQLQTLPPEPTPTKRKTQRPPTAALVVPELPNASGVETRQIKEPPKLFPFQRKVINEIYNHIRQNEKRILLVAACGAGKTLISSWIIRDATLKAKNPMRCMFLVKFNCLLDQAAEELRGLGVECSILQGSRKFDNNADVVVASIQTIRARLKKQSMSEILGRFGLVLADEAHELCYDKIYAQIEEHFLKTGTVFIGLTATPWRTSRSQYLGQWFDVLVEAPQPPELIKMGRLVPCRIFGFGQVFDFTQLDLGRDGDYRVDQMEEQAIRKASLDLVVKEYRRLASDRTAAAYCVSVEHARLLSEAFNQAGVRSEWLSGATSREERDAINERLSLGVTRVVCSVGTLTTGWNVPSVGCIIMDRATTSKALMFQIAGRGGRSFPGKHDYLLLDFGNNQRHGNPTSYQEYDIGPKNFRKKQDSEFMKACPECGFMNYNWARICSECDHEFELLKDQEQEEDDDVAPQDVELVERFLGIDRVKLAFLRQQKRECFKHDISPDEAINAFLKEYGHLPPDEWHAQAILGRSPSNKRKKQFEEYLKKHAVHDYWYRRQHKLEFQPAPSGNQQTKRKSASFDSKGVWWQVLGVSRICTRDDAKQAYKALIRTAHPDVNPQDREGAEARTKLLNAAWEDAKRYFDGA